MYKASLITSAAYQKTTTELWPAKDPHQISEVQKAFVNRRNAANEFMEAFGKLAEKKLKACTGPEREQMAACLQAEAVLILHDLYSPLIPVGTRPTQKAKLKEAPDTVWQIVLSYQRQGHKKSTSPASSSDNEEMERGDIV